MPHFMRHFKEMKFTFPFLKKEKEKRFFVLDIGTETVKALIFEKSEQNKIAILGASLQYFDKFGVFDCRAFEKNVMKEAISKAVEETKTQAGVEVNSVLLGLPANILKGKVVFQLFKRKNLKQIINKEEEKEIYQNILKEARKKISQIYASQKGILPGDIQFLDSKILETRIDGYRVPNLRGYEGENLDFRILNTFLPKYYLKNIEDIVQALNFENVNIVHEAQNLTFCLNEMPNGVFLDVGGEVTKIFLVEKGILKQVDEFEMGGQFFSQILSEKLGLGELRARILKERYSKKVLSKESSEKIKEILWLDTKTWLESLKLKLKELSGGALLSPAIFLFGGGSLLPEIEEILIKDFSFTDQPRVKFIYPKDLKKIEDRTKNLNSPQNISSLLICYNVLNSSSPPKARFANSGGC